MRPGEPASLSVEGLEVKCANWLKLANNQPTTSQDSSLVYGWGFHKLTVQVFCVVNCLQMGFAHTSELTSELHWDTATTQMALIVFAEVYHGNILDARSGPLYLARCHFMFLRLFIDVLESYEFQ